MRELPARLFRSNCQDCLLQYCFLPKSSICSCLLLGKFMRAWVNYHNSVIPRTPIFQRLPFRREYSQCIVSLANRALKNLQVKYLENKDIRADLPKLLSFYRKTSFIKKILLFGTFVFAFVFFFWGRGVVFVFYSTHLWCILKSYWGHNRAPMNTAMILIFALFLNLLRDWKTLSSLCCFDSSKYPTLLIKLRPKYYSCISIFSVILAMNKIFFSLSPFLDALFELVLSLSHVFVRSFYVIHLLRWNIYIYCFTLDRYQYLWVPLLFKLSHCRLFGFKSIDGVKFGCVYKFWNHFVDVRRNKVKNNQWVKKNGCTPKHLGTYPTFIVRHYSFKVSLKLNIKRTSKQFKPLLT